MDGAIEAMAERLEAGETVKVFGFGSFSQRDKGPRIGCNPWAGEAATVTACRALVFNASEILKRRVADGIAGARHDRQARH